MSAVSLEMRNEPSEVSGSVNTFRHLERFASEQAPRQRRRRAVAVDEQLPLWNSTSTPCRYCGRDEDQSPQTSARNQPAVFQVVVACASCGRSFAAISRN